MAAGTAGDAGTGTGAGVGVKPSNLGMGPCDRASSGEGSRPACACPISRKTTPKPAGVRKPLFSLSAICHICFWVIRQLAAAGQFVVPKERTRND